MFGTLCSTVRTGGEAYPWSRRGARRTREPGVPETTPEGLYGRCSPQLRQACKGDMGRGEAVGMEAQRNRSTGGSERCATEPDRVGQQAFVQDLAGSTAERRCTAVLASARFLRFRSRSLIMLPALRTAIQPTLRAPLLAEVFPALGGEDLGGRTYQVCGGSAFSKP